MFAFEAAGALVLFLAMAVLAIYFYGRSCYQAGFEDGRSAAYGRKLARTRAERAGRHRAGQPRAFPSPAPAAAPPEPTRTTLVRSGYRDSWREPGPVDLPRCSAIGVHLARAAVSAADIAQVFLPPQAAPDKRGAEDTGTMPRTPATEGPTAENGYWNPRCKGKPCCCHGSAASGQHNCCIHGPAGEAVMENPEVARVRLESGDTGEMRAVTSAWIAENCPGAEAIA